MGGYLYLRVVPLFLKLHLTFCSMILYLSQDMYNIYHENIYKTIFLF